MAFTSVKQLLAAAAEQNLPLWKVIMNEDTKDRGASKEESQRQMGTLWAAMQSADSGYSPAVRSKSGLVGGDGEKMHQYAEKGAGIAGAYLSDVIAQALRMGESNACMKRIVAAPTAGSCGVLPAVLIPFAKENKTSDQEITAALFIAAGFGQIIASRASISGAEGGCQAEIGSASAMAAAALVSLKNGTAQQSADACAMALMNLLGLVCDPVAGLVEIPCVKRNVIGAVNAISCADMALAGIGSAIPPDEVIDAMREVGDKLPASLKETGTGGLAATPTGIAAAKKIHGSHQS
ncbi:MAG: L-serine ammonia-lyase, iron-sulfur-dependent, subunit alpha [Oscillospiraceae bacterium]|jgi:L-serine dehydratase|nr:L-serine ammonia-lyase, iron-sulfur-dependent, subunit alpha [Oscillospiraceae bacterium]